MTETGHGVGLNAEPDDFSARYDRFVTGAGARGWVILTLGTLVGLLALIAAVAAVLR